jgi:hypothetical protein
MASPSAVNQLLLTTPPAAVSPSLFPLHTPFVGPDAFHDNHLPTIDIPIEHPSRHQSPGKAAKSSFASTGALLNESDAQMRGRIPATAAAGTILSLFTFSQIYQNVLFNRITPNSERAEEKSWVATSHSWLDRKVCAWFGFCGVGHLNQAAWTTCRKEMKQEDTLPLNQSSGHSTFNLTEFWESSTIDPQGWSDDERILREIPNYVLEHAPYIHLYSGEHFWPCDIAEHLIHTTPHLNYTALQPSSDHPNLTHLDYLNSWGRFVYLQSDDNVEDRPDWLGGETNIPTIPDDSDAENWADWELPPGKGFTEDKDGEAESWFSSGIGDTINKGGIRPIPKSNTAPVPIPTETVEGEQLVYEGEDSVLQVDRSRRSQGEKLVGGRSDAPAVLIVVEKDDGVVDAFFFFFYSYNLGNTVFNVRFGNHVGDWEHTVVRFQHGEPKAIFFSEHNFGEAYHWDAVEKIGKRVSQPHTAIYWSLTRNSLSDSPQLEAMQCTQRRGFTLMSSLAVSSTMLPIGGHSGTQSSI